MIKIFVVLILLVSPTLASSQSLVFDGGNDMNRGTGLLETTPITLNETYKGSPYIMEEFTLMKLSKIEGETFKARYNAVNDAMEVIGEDGKYYNIVRDPNLDITFIVSNKKYRIFNTEENTDKTGYFVVLNDGELKLLKKETIKFYDEILANTSYDKAEPAKFKREKDEFYFQKNDKTLVEIPKNKNNFTSLLSLDSDKNSKVLSYIKKQRIRLNDEQDLKNLFIFINSINI
ncbi:MAG: hypothetical protein ABI295_05330 [Xanthomarina sp.]